MPKKLSFSKFFVNWIYFLKTPTERLISSNARKGLNKLHDESSNDEKDLLLKLCIKFGNFSMYMRGLLVQLLFLVERNAILQQWKYCDKLIDEFGLIKTFVKKCVCWKSGWKNGSICEFIWAKIFTHFKTVKK